LARAWLISDLSEDDRIAAEGAMLMLLDDASPLVRQAMSDVFSTSPDAPAAIVAALAGDQLPIALPVLEFSPLLVDADLVDIVAIGCSETQCAIARRAQLPVSVSAAIAEVGSAEAVLDMIENPSVTLAPFSIDRIVERHGHLSAIRESLLRLDDLPVSTRVNLVAKTSATLARFVAARDWMTPERADRIAAEAVERSMVDMAASSQGEALAGLVRHLRATGQLTAGLILRALLSGNAELFEASLVELTGLPPRRVASLMYDRGGASLNALLTKAQLPASTFMAFRAAMQAIAEVGFIDTDEASVRLQRRMVERVLTLCESQATLQHEPLLVLLRRFATEAAREEARLFCEEAATEIDALQFVQAIENAPPLADVEMYDDYTAFDEDYTEVNDNEASIVAQAPDIDEGAAYAEFDEDYVALNDEYDAQYAGREYMNIRIGERIAA
jgi:uncharacterized protein (DUF2336 family)